MDSAGAGHRAQPRLTRLARLAARIDDSARRAKPRARRFAETGAEKDASRDMPSLHGQLQRRQVPCSVYRIVTSRHSTLGKQAG